MYIGMQRMYAHIRCIYIYIYLFIYLKNYNYIYIYILYSYREMSGALSRALVTCLVAPLLLDLSRSDGGRSPDPFGSQQRRPTMS